LASTINAKSTGSGSLETTADASGQLALQANGTTIATISSTGLAVTGAITTNGVTGSPYTMKNRIINGAMVIDQRNSGAAVSGSPSYPVDRFRQSNSGAGVLQGQQVSDAPAGFNNSVKFTVTTIDSSIAAGEYYQFEHFIEGYNVADFNWGTANAKTVTLSFWAKASQTGTYSVALANDAGDRSYASFYTILAANTWEFKTITVSGSTSGTWLTTNGCGIGIRFGIVYGSTYSGATANTWVTTSGFANAFITSTNNMMSTLNATLQITGVQLEVGSSATQFEWRPYGTELQLCQRYCILFSVTAINTFFGSGFSYNSVNALAYTAFPVPMRTSPTVTYSNVGHFGVYDGSAGTIVTTALTAYSSSPNAIGTRATVASGLTTGQGTMLKDNGTTSATILCTSEL
jgi:predicted secreted protein